MRGEQILVHPQASVDSTQPGRVVYLREATIVLRWLFGYYDEQGSTSSSIFGSWPSLLPTRNLEQKKINFKGATFVGIDIDELKEEDGMPVQFHMGISILHTQDLQNLCQKPLRYIRSAPSIIRSLHWVVEDERYFDRNDSRFCFGKQACLPLPSLGRHLKELLGGTSSPLILVVHGGYRETNLLERLDIKLGSIFTIDTTKAARYPLQVLYDYTLRGLLEAFGIPFTGHHLHVAGNDAHFTLRALLMIAVVDARRELAKVPAWVPVFEAVARAPLPAMPLLRAQREAMKRRGEKGWYGTRGNGW